jgi:hypothetical protein
MATRSGPADLRVLEAVFERRVKNRVDLAAEVGEWELDEPSTVPDAHDDEPRRTPKSTTAARSGGVPAVDGGIENEETSSQTVSDE